MNAAIRIYNPTTMGEPKGLYSHVAHSKAHEHLYIAGQVAIDRAGELVGRGDFEAQMRQVYANLAAALESAGAGFGDVVRFTTYLTRRENLAEYGRVRRIEAVAAI